MDSYTEKYLTDLIKYTEKALDRVKILRIGEDITGAINWGQLHCVDALRCESLNDGVYYEVLIEEAAPDNEKLRSFVREYLKQNGFDNIEVTTEW